MSGFGEMILGESLIKTGNKEKGIKKIKEGFVRADLSKGDLLCFDNRRILHGRTSFDTHSGNRHLQGYYIEREEVNSKLNYLKKILI